MEPTVLSAPALNNKKSSGLATTGGVLDFDEIPTDVADAGGRIGDNKFGSAEVVAVGGRITMGDTAGGAITASTYSGAHNALSSLTGVIIVGSDTTSMNTFCNSLSIS